MDNIEIEWSQWDDKSIIGKHDGRIAAYIISEKRNLPVTGRLITVYSVHLVDQRENKSHRLALVYMFLLNAKAAASLALSGPFRSYLEKVS